MLGNGTLASPFIIQSATDLNNVRNNLTSYYQLGNDIDLSSIANFVPIGTNASRFKGQFDGKNFTISNLKIDTTTQYTALFAHIDVTAVVKNIKFMNANVKTTTTGAAVAVGVAYANSTSKSLIDNIAVYDSQITGEIRVSSICAMLQGTLKNCYSDAHLTTTSALYPRSSGITMCDVSMNDSVSDCVFNGTIEATTTNTSANYFISPTVLEANADSITNCYYNSDKYTYAPSTKSVGLTTQQFADSTNFNLDENYWSFGKVPYLKAFGVQVVPNRHKVTVESTIGNITSSVKTAKKKFVNTTTYLQRGKSDISVFKRLNKNVTTYINSIYASATQTNRQVTRIDIKVSSYMQPITCSASIKGKKKAYRYANSYITKITANARISTNASLEITDKLMAWGEVIENQSSHSANFNTSYVYYIENPSNGEEIY